MWHHYRKHTIICIRISSLLFHHVIFKIGILAPTLSLEGMGVARSSYKKWLTIRLCLYLSHSISCVYRVIVDTILWYDESVKKQYIKHQFSLSSSIYIYPHTLNNLSVWRQTCHRFSNYVPASYTPIYDRVFLLRVWDDIYIYSNAMT